MLPLIAGNGRQALGLVEVYDVRLRQFDPGDVAAGQRLVDAASRRIEQLASEGVELGAVGTDDAPVHGRCAAASRRMTSSSSASPARPARPRAAGRASYRGRCAARSRAPRSR